jgi:hypothetical protein
MIRIIFAAAAALAVTQPAMSAPQAAAGRTFVSAAGSDSNNCANVATPCRHLANAYAVTAPNGEIYVLDPANYGALTITGPVSIEGHGWASIAPVSGSAAITVNANTGDKINIIGVVLDGTGIANTSGIQFNSGGTLTVRDSVIRNFTNSGIGFTPTFSVSITNQLCQIFVSNALLSDNGGNGITISANGSGGGGGGGGGGGQGNVAGVLSHVEMENNGNWGLAVGSAQPAINVTVSDSVAAGNSSGGITIEAVAAPSSVMVRGSTIADNGTGLATTGSGGTIRVTRSTMTGNGAGWSAASGAVLSYGDNNIDDNGSANTEPPNPVVYK